MKNKPLESKSKRKRNRFARCYTLLILLAGKKLNTSFVSNRVNKSNEISLVLLILKEKYKLEYGIKSLKELDTSKKLKEFEAFLTLKL